jgi:hypothetical protein
VRLNVEFRPSVQGRENETDMTLRGVVDIGVNAALQGRGNK